MIGEKIRKAREAKGLTQAQLGELIGVSKVAICRYEIETLDPPSRVLKAIAEALGVSVSDILD